MPEGQKGTDSFFVACRQAAVALHPVKKPLNFVAVFVLLLVKRGGLRSVGPVRNDDLDAYFRVIDPVSLAVVAGIGDDLARREVGQ